MQSISLAVAGVPHRTTATALNFSRFTTMTPHSVFCIAPSHDSANRMVQQLRDSYFFKNDISVLFHDQTTRLKARTAKATNMLSGPLGWISDVGALPIPGVGQFIAGGPVKEALSSPAHTSGSNRIADGLMTLGLPEPEAEHFAGKIKAGQIFLAIHPYASNEAVRAEDIISAAHAQSVYTLVVEPVPEPPLYGYVTV